MRVRYTLLMLSMLASAPAAAGDGGAAAIVVEAQPLTYMRDGTVQGCGVRFTGGEPGTPSSSWFDVSVNVFNRGVGLAQSIAYEIRRSEFDGESRPERVPVRSTWVKTAEGSTRLGESTERRESLIYRLLVDDVLAVFEAVATGQPVTLGIRRWGERVDTVYTATPVLTEDSGARMSTCLASLKLN